MHIYPNLNTTDITLLSEESAAAIKIQARFRGYRVRKQLKNIAEGRRNSGIVRRHNNNNYNNISSHHRKFYRNNPSYLTRYLQTNSKQGLSMPVMSQTEDSGVMVMNRSNSATGHHHYAGSESESVEDRCATKIQAGIRGYLVRKKQKQEADAATKIQAGFRGFKARKELQLKREK